MTRARSSRLILLGFALAATSLCARAGLYTLESATFDERFEMPGGFNERFDTFELPFQPSARSTSAEPRAPAGISYLALALRSAPEAHATEQAAAPPVSFALAVPSVSVDMKPLAASTDMRALAAANATNLGTYQGNLWSLITVNLNGPSGNSLFGFAKANFSEIAFEAPASVPLPDGTWLFASGLLGLAGWHWRRHRPARNGAGPLRADSI